MSVAAPTQEGTLQDASAIGKSWDRIVSDYKIFQDVRARGGTVDDLPIFPEAFKTGQEASQNAKPETNHGTTQKGREPAPSLGGIASHDAVIDGSAIVVDSPSMGSNGVGNSDRPSRNTLGDEASKPAVEAAVTGAHSQAFSAGASDANQSQPPVPGLLSPQAVLGRADDNMKKLLMSWYYAGYYTGLYEGQQQQRQQGDEGVGHEKEDGDAEIDMNQDEEAPK